MKSGLTAAETAIMEATFKATMLRAADILDGITSDLKAVVGSEGGR